MKVVYYKLPDEPEDVVVASSPDTFSESDIALLFEQQDETYPYRYHVICEDAIVRATKVDSKEEFRFFVEDHNNFSCVIPSDSTENAIISGKYIHRCLIEHEQYYDRLGD